MFYFASWNAKARRDWITEAELASCWRIGFGYTLLHKSGMARIKLVGKGTANDLPGEWRWILESSQSFTILRTDGDAEDQLASRRVITVSRYNGQTLEIEDRGFFNLDPAGIPEPKLWRRAKFPKSWSQWDDGE